jgi:hypothetical protein
MHETRDEQGVDATRRWSASPWSFGLGAYAVALAVWAAVGLVYLPILSMILTPVWMVLWVSVVPRAVQRLRGRARSRAAVRTERTEAA